MTRGYSEKMLAEVEAATPAGEPDVALGFRDIWRGMGLWAPVTVRNALVELNRQGRVTREGDPSYWKYRRRPE